jgi:hypothetical protein
MKDNLGRTFMKRIGRSIAAHLGAVCLGIVAIAATAVAEPANGTITFKSKSGLVTVDVKHAFLIKEPDRVSGKTIRRILLSPTDVSAALKKCSDLTCSDADVREGMTIDFDAGPRIKYWLVAIDQLVQYSGTADPSTIKLTTDAPDRVAGLWDFDDSAGGGPVIKVEFDARLVKTLPK